MALSDITFQSPVGPQDFQGQVEPVVSTGQWAVDYLGRVHSAQALWRSHLARCCFSLLLSGRTVGAECTVGARITFCVGAQLVLVITLLCQSLAGWQSAPAAYMHMQGNLSPG